MAFVGELAHRVEDLLAGADVRADRRLVEDQQRGLVDDRHRRVQSPLLPAGQRARGGVELRRQAQRLADLLDVRPNLAPAQSGQLGEQLEVAPHGQRRVDAEILGSDAEMATRLQRFHQRVDAVDQHGPGVRAPQPGDTRDERRLARSVVPQQTCDLAGFDLEIDAFEHVQAAVGLAHTARKKRRLCLRCAPLLSIGRPREDHLPAPPRIAHL